MTTLSGSSTADIDAPIERCWTVVAAIDRAPQWQAGLESVTVIERDAEGRPEICDIVHDAKITKVSCRVRVLYEPPRRLTFTRVDSEDLDDMEGGWELEELGPERTRATYRLSIDPGPVPLVARPLVNALRPLVVGGRAAELGRAVAAAG